jgi:hypothetical protein
MDMNHLTTAIVAARDVLWRAPANSVFTSSFGLEDMVLLDMIAEDEQRCRPARRRGSASLGRRRPA